MVTLSARYNQPGLEHTDSHGLPKGSTLGPYEIVALVGNGGRGEVYRPRDTKLGRAVAVKVLPEAFALGTKS